MAMVGMCTSVAAGEMKPVTLGVIEKLAGPEFGIAIVNCNPAD